MERIVKLEGALMGAARVGSHAFVKLLLERGVRADAKDRHSERDRGDTALQIAQKYSFDGAREGHMPWLWDCWEGFQEEKNGVPTSQQNPCGGT
jgi:hypothetical protein